MDLQSFRFNVIKKYSFQANTIFRKTTQPVRIVPVRRQLHSRSLNCLSTIWEGVNCFSTVAQSQACGVLQLLSINPNLAVLGDASILNWQLWWSIIRTLQAVEAEYGFKPFAILLAFIFAFGFASNHKSKYPIKNLPSSYCPDILQEYFATQPVKVIQRQLQVMQHATSFIVMLLMDWQLNQLQQNMSKRAAQLKDIMEHLGPAYVKMAQMMSTRVDMLPPEYLTELSKLQDNVQPFASEEALQVIQEEFGSVSKFEGVEWQEPVASASLGQVYKGYIVHPTTAVLTEVAVKIQRPKVLYSVALDIYLMRSLLKLISMLPTFHEDWVKVMDDWAARFFQEMDYDQEARYAKAFAINMASLEGIIVPEVWDEYSRRRVLTTEWVEGEKLVNSRENDTLQLCRTLLNCYLIQLLETGFLHADPHPGNLLRTPDGYICILDFGLMTEVTNEQRITLVEYIIHLTLQDWEAVAEDLVKLGFMPDGVSMDTQQEIVPIIKEVMSKLVGGGRNGVNIGKLAAELESTAQKYKMVIPPYFALILRAFSTIEGIGLSIDPNYAIVSECFPYLCRRLLKDNDENMKIALRKLLCGDGPRLRPEQVRKLLDGLNSFTTSPQQQSNTQGQLSRTKFKNNTNNMNKEALRLVFSKESSTLQKLLMEELAAVVDTLSKEALREALELFLSSATTATYAMEALGPLSSMFIPLPQPRELISSLQPQVALSTEDQQSLLTIRMLLELVEGMVDAGNVGRRALSTVTDLAPMVPELMPGIRASLKIFIRELARRYALRLAESFAK